MSSRPKANVILQKAYLGDCILTFPLIERIYKTYPDRELIYICREGFGSFIKACFDYVQPIEVKQSDSVTYKNCEKLLSDNFEIENIYCVHQSLRSFLFSRKIKASHRYYFTNTLTSLFLEGVKRDTHLPEALRVLSLLSPSQEKVREEISEWKEQFEEPLSIKNEVPAYFRSNLSSTPTKKFDIPEDYAVVAPGSVWFTKIWPAESYAELAKRIYDEFELPVIVLGSNNEFEKGELISERFPQVINLVGKTSLVDCMRIIANSKAFVGNDSGLLHMAALFDIPSVGIFGPTHEKLGFRPWQNKARIASLGLKCSPCGTHGSATCPIGTHSCMEDLKAQVIISHLKSLFEKDKKLEESFKLSPLQLDI